MPRRLPGDGALFYSPARQRYVARVVVDGRRVTRLRRTEREARRVLQQMRRGEVRRRTTRERTGDYLTRWLDEQVALGRYRPNTVRTYRSLLPVIAAGLGHYPLDALAPREVQTFIAAITAEYKPASVQLMRALLSAALKDAESLGLVADNPLRKTRGPKVQQQNRTAPSAADVRALVDRFVPPYHGIVTVAAHLGLRQSEVLGLRWSDIGVATLHVAGQLDRAGAWTPQRKRGDSLVLPLVGSVQAALSRQRAHQAAQRLAAGPAWQDGEFVFTNDDGTAIRQWQISMAFGRTVKDSGLPFKSFHDLRHAANSLLDELGVDQGTRLAILGHAALRTNLGYLHTNERRTREALETLDRAIGGG